MKETYHFDQASISVIIPVHNRAKRISRALNSALSQKHPPQEILVVDDYSSDEIESTIGNYDPRVVKLIRLKNKTNAANARNIGAHAARSKYIAFLDSDDFWLPEHLESKLEVLASYPEAKGVYGSFLVTSEDSYLMKFIPPPLKTSISPAEYILNNGDARTSTFVFERDAFLSIGFDCKLTKHQDWDLFIRFANCYLLVIDTKVTAHLDYGGKDRMSAVPNHQGTSYFINKHKDSLQQQTLGNFYCSLAMITLLTEGRSSMYYFYYKKIPWDIKCGFYTLIKKFILALPLPPRSMHGFQLFWRKIRVRYLN